MTLNNGSHYPECKRGGAPNGAWTGADYSIGAMRAPPGCIEKVGKIVALAHTGKTCTATEPHAESRTSAVQTARACDGLRKRSYTSESISIHAQADAVGA